MFKNYASHITCLRSFNSQCNLSTFRWWNWGTATCPNTYSYRWSEPIFKSRESVSTAGADKTLSYTTLVPPPFSSNFQSKFWRTPKMFTHLPQYSMSSGLAPNACSRLPFIASLLSVASEQGSTFEFPQPFPHYLAEPEFLTKPVSSSVLEYLLFPFQEHKV